MIAWFHERLVYPLCLYTGALFFSLKSFGNDTAYLRVTKVLTAEKRSYYWLKDVNTKERYYTVCECPPRKKGEIVKLVKRDMEFIPGKIKFE